MKRISIRFLQWVIVLLLIFLFLVAVDLLGYPSPRKAAAWRLSLFKPLLKKTLPLEKILNLLSSGINAAQLLQNFLG